MLIGDEYLQLILSRGLLMDPTLDLLERLLDVSSFLAIFVPELVEGQFVHFLLDEHQYLIDLLDEIHLFYHLSLFHLLQVHLLLDHLNLSLLGVFHLI